MLFFALLGMSVKIYPNDFTVKRSKGLYEPNLPKNILALDFFWAISGLLSHVIEEFSKNSIVKVGGKSNQN